jgi:UDPglucose 6-dehydrogenase/GDP-mannose 6-dehydrogenase
LRISIVGTGYVGLVSGVCLASSGHLVTCIDIKPEVVGRINRGDAPFYEPALGDLLASVVAAGRLKASNDIHRAVLETDVTLICVGTPTVGYEADLSQIVSASEAIGAALAEKATYHVVVVKSTVLPGTTEGGVKDAIESRAGKPQGDGWDLCMNPEFLREGHAVEDFLASDRIVIGASEGRAAEVLLKLYEHLDCPKLVTSPQTAEMIKYVTNSLLATMISFSNEVANLCSAIPGIDAREVWRGVHLDRRLTPMVPAGSSSPGLIEYLWHGLGFGGSCLPKDTKALQGFGKRLGTPTPILEAVLSTNSSQPLQLVALLRREMDLVNRTIAVLGVAFKPGTDDVRESPAVPVVTTLRQHGARVIVHDPVGMAQAQVQAAFQDVTFAPDWQTALNGADACCLITAWPEYRLIRPEDFVRLMRRPLVIDGRGMFDPARLAEVGVAWRGIGYTLAERAQPLG